MGLTADIGIPAVIGLAIIGILYLLKGFLSFVIGVPIWIGAAIIVSALILIFIPTNILLSFFRYGKEGFIFMQARKEGVPVICDVEIGTGNAEYVLGKKRNPKDPLFEDESSGLKADPSMVAAFSEPLRFPGGLDIVGYSYHDFLPQTHRNHLAFKAIANYLNPETPCRPNDRLTQSEKRELSCFTVKELIELISKAEHFLDVDVETKLGKYFNIAKNEDGSKMTDKNGNTLYYRQFQLSDGRWMEQSSVTVPSIVTLIRKAKADISELPIWTGYFSMNEAFKYNNVPYSAQHLSQLKSLLVQRLTEQYMKMLNWMQYGMIIVGIIMAGTIAIYVLASTVFK